MMLLPVHDAGLPGIAMFILLSLAFWLFGRNIRIFSAAFAALLTGFFLLRHQAGAAQLTADAILAIGGFVLYFFGLLIVRIIILRSISLHLLLHPDPRTRLEVMKAEIDHRFSDMARYKLAIKKDGCLTLTLFGRFMAGFITFFYRFTGRLK